MVSIWAIGIVVFVYLATLFAVAFWGDKYRSKRKPSPYIYAFATGIHCTSWAFFGTITQASQYGWAIIPTYVGMSLSMILAFPVVMRIGKLCQQHNISSLADFVGLLYRGSHSVSASVSIICFIGVIPYIALQLDALTMSIGLLTGLSSASSTTVSFYIAALMALFAILFGTRTLVLADKHPGLMLSIAFESIVKLAALVFIGFYVTYYLFDGVSDIVLQSSAHPSASNILAQPGSVWAFLSHVLLGACCLFILPRQFHVSFVELNDEKELRTARWFLPLFLFAMTIFVLPITLAGHILLPADGINTDALVLAIPMSQGSTVVSLVAFIGGLAATTSMIIVATLAMGVMIANNIATPLWLRFTLSRKKSTYMQPKTILTVRRITVFVVLAIAYWYHINISQNAPLVKSGVVAMALMAQVLVPMLFGLYWSKANSLSALLGLVAGLTSWSYWLLYPSILSSYYFEEAPTDQALGFGFIYSISVNIFVYWLACFTGHKRKTLKEDFPETHHTSVAPFTIRLEHLLSLAEKALDDNAISALRTGLGDRAHQLDKFAAPVVVERFESLLAARVGAPGARIILSTLSTSQAHDVDDLVGWVEEAQQGFHFNHEVLQSSVQHIQQGISVLDNQLNMLAWNERYIDLFDYPEGFIKVGLSVRALLQFNAERGLFGNEQMSQAEIEKRITFMRNGSEYKYIRKQPDGRVVELSGSPLPGGGYVTTYSDISEYITIQDALQDAKTDLEKRVAERTEELNVARLQAEQANDSKTRFLAAAGHDLMQPFNAAALFADMLQQKTRDTELASLSEGLSSSLENAESLLTTLLDITKLESGAQQVNLKKSRLHDILHPLYVAMLPVANNKGLKLRYVPTCLWVNSDPALLRRMIQNLLANAIRYTEVGGVVLGVRRNQNNQVVIQVTDTGVGIADSDQQVVFNEFHQLNPNQHKQGLGLGLTIVSRIAELLNHDINLNSRPGKGTTFSVCVPKAAAQTTLSGVNRTNLDDAQNKQFLTGQSVVIVENDEQILEALSALIKDWGADVIAVKNKKAALESCQSVPFALIVDYQLDNNENGLDVANSLYAQWERTPLSVLSSANLSPDLREACVAQGLQYLPKPLKPLALKRLFKQALHSAKASV